MGPDVPPKARVVVREPEADQPLDERLPRRVGAEGGGSAGTRKLCQDLRAVRREPGRPPGKVGRVRRDREHEREPGKNRFERPVTGFGARHADVHVQAADALPAGGYTGEADELLVARIGGYLLLLGVAERMAAGGRDPEAVLGGDPRRLAAKHPQGLVRPG